MVTKTFPGGVHPPYSKEYTRNLPIKRASLPSKVVLPLSQHTGAICQPTVSVGDEVKPGTLIGKSDKFISAYVHSPISGKVTNIELKPHPVLGTCMAVVVESDGKSSPEEQLEKAPFNIEDFTADKIITSVRDAGIVGLGGAAFPTHVKLTVPEDKKIDFFILNGIECEPYLSCDHRLMLEEPDKIIKGALLIMKAIGVKRGIIAIEDNKPDAINIMKDKAKQLETIAFKTKYPQGGEKQIIKALLGREVPPGKLPLDVGCMVANVGTAFSVYEACVYKKALYERVITAAGSAVKTPQNLFVKIGTPISSIIEECGGLIKDLGKIIFGGPMMGLCQYDLDIPVIKGTSGILFLAKEEAIPEDKAHCIRCGKCVEVCPLNLIPTTIALASENSRMDIASEFNAVDCIECGACSYVCPSKIPLVHLIKQAKGKLQCQIT